MKEYENSVIYQDDKDGIIYPKNDIFRSTAGQSFHKSKSNIQFYIAL